MTYTTREGRARAAARHRARDVAKTRATGAWSAAKKLNRLVPWANREVVSAIYAVANAWCDAGEPAHVDHVVPMKGADVSGLHCEQNLTVLPRLRNLIKGNRMHRDGA